MRGFYTGWGLEDDDYAILAEGLFAFAQLPEFSRDTEPVRMFV
jgi:hypothetical protein